MLLSLLGKVGQDDRVCMEEKGMDDIAKAAIFLVVNNDIFLDENVPFGGNNRRIRFDCFGISKRSLMRSAPGKKKIPCPDVSFGCVLSCSDASDIIVGKGNDSSAVHCGRLIRTEREVPVIKSVLLPMAIEIDFMIRVNMQQKRWNRERRVAIICCINDAFFMIIDVKLSRYNRIIVVDDGNNTRPLALPDDQKAQRNDETSGNQTPYCYQPLLLRQGNDDKRESRPA